MKYNTKILLYDLVTALFTLVFSLSIIGLVLFKVVEPSNKILMIIAGVILVPIFILNIYWFFKTKETDIGVINILVTLVLSVIVILICVVISGYFKGLSLVTFASLCPMVLGARFQYNIGFYFKVKYNQAKVSMSYQSKMELKKLVSNVFTYLPTIILILVAIGTIALLFV